MEKPKLDLSKARKEIVSFIKRKVENSGSEGVVLGISGGIDSAVTAYLCVESLGSKRVMALLMPDMRITPESDIEDAGKIIQELCVESKTIDIAPIHRSFMKFLSHNVVAEGNLRARIRMALLYYHANIMNRLVAGTGDKSELLLGYFTKYGDGGVDFLPIGDLYKTEVRKLGEMLGISRRIVTKKSSPRLWAGQTAEAEIGLSYEEIDKILIAYFEDNLSMLQISKKLKLEKEKVQRIISRCEINKHKLSLPEICVLR
jgi:NAD+ synthase